jgi:hypothetical protein
MFDPNQIWITSLPQPFNYLVLNGISDCYSRRQAMPVTAGVIMLHASKKPEKRLDVLLPYHQQKEIVASHLRRRRLSIKGEFQTLPTGCITGAAILIECSPPGVEPYLFSTPNRHDLVFAFPVRFRNNYPFEGFYVPFKYRPQKHQIKLSGHDRDLLSFLLAVVKKSHLLPTGHLSIPRTLSKLFYNPKRRDELCQNLIGKSLFS